MPWLLRLPNHSCRLPVDNGSFGVGSVYECDDQKCKRKWEWIHAPGGKFRWCRAMRPEEQYLID